MRPVHSVSGAEIVLGGVGILNWLFFQMGFRNESTPAGDGKEEPTEAASSDSMREDYRRWGDRTRHFGNALCTGRRTDFHSICGRCAILRDEG